MSHICTESHPQSPSEFGKSGRKKRWGGTEHLPVRGLGFGLVKHRALYKQGKQAARLFSVSGTVSPKKWVGVLLVSL